MKIAQKLVPLFLWGAIAIPIDQGSLWTELKYKKIPANEVAYSKDALRISVNESASPLIFGFSEIKKITKISADIEIEGSMKDLPAGVFQEDSYFRLGLVAEGKNKLGGVASFFAPEWVQKMFSLAPKGSRGLDKIYFFNVTSQPELLGKTRQNPKSQYIHEENQTLWAGKTPSLRIEKSFEPPLATAGIWISVDGDDSKSHFNVRIRKLEYSTADQ